ncbi:MULTISPECIES: Uma2 family endonuclease [unclassified Microcoleus]|uniref:Uma2 family endonuclease n=1 Tax=unclassified Microcoleus TaxID=2642155 RepID=UPI002FCFF034
MTAENLTSPTQNIQLSGITWQTYETLVAEFSHLPLRLKYNGGNLEILEPSPEHQFYQTIIGRFVETLAEELGLNIAAVGSTTFKRPELSIAEPNECFYIQNLCAIKGQTSIDTNENPPPDLVVELDLTSFWENSLQVYADVGVPEVWIYNGERLIINKLEKTEYFSCDRSLAFPTVHILEIVEFLHQAETMDYLELVKAFRNGVKSEILPTN